MSRVPDTAKSLSGPFCDIASREPAIFARIDAHAGATPTAPTANIRSLANCLASAASSDLEKARAIYRWMTANIAYDDAAYFSRQFPPMDAAAVLARRTAVCAGYANLFAPLGRAMGLQVEVVRGFAKGYRYRIGESVAREPNHDWTVVQVGGHWYLVDSTWGAGDADAKGEFVRRYTDFYFLPPPQQFIYRHLPLDPMWQLLDPAVSRSEFERLAYLHEGFFRFGLQLRSHREAVIESGTSLTIELGAPSGTFIMASVNDSPDAVGVTRTAPGFAIDFRFPDTGRYALAIFARAGSSQGTYDAAAEYLIHAGSHGPGRGADHSTSAAEGCRDIKALLPRQARLPRGRIEFAILAPGAVAVAVLQGGRRAHLAKNGTEFRGKVALRAGRCQVVGRFPGGRDYEVILEYEVAKGGFFWWMLCALIFFVLLLFPVLLSAAVATVVWAATAAEVADDRRLQARDLDSGRCLGVRCCHGDLFHRPCSVQSP